MGKLATIIFLIFAELTLLALGSWQVYRLDYKNKLIAQISSTINSAPAKEIAEPLEFYRQVKLTGKFITDKSINMYNLRDGKVVYDKITPMQISSNKFILVNMHDLDKVGILTPLPKKSLFTPNNSPAQSLWYNYDLKEIEAYTGLALLPALIESHSSLSTKNIRNDHLGYALIWYSLAIILAIIAWRKNS